LSKAVALQQAQLLLLHGTAGAASAGLERGAHSVAAPGAAPATFRIDPKAPFAHPYFWAPFILIGNWR